MCVGAQEELMNHGRHPRRNLTTLEYLSRYMQVVDQIHCSVHICTKDAAADLSQPSDDDSPGLEVLGYLRKEIWLGLGIVAGWGWDFYLVLTGDFIWQGLGLLGGAGDFIWLGLEVCNFSWLGLGVWAGRHRGFYLAGVRNFSWLGLGILFDWGWSC